MKRLILNASYKNKSYEEKEALKALDNEKHTSLDDNLVQQLGGPLIEEDVEISDTEIDSYIEEEVYTEDIQFKDDCEQLEEVPTYNFDAEVNLENAFEGYEIERKDDNLVFTLSNNLIAKSITNDRRKKRKIKEKKYKQIDGEIESLYAQFQNYGYDFEYDMPEVEEVKVKSKKVCEEWNAVKPRKNVNGPKYIKKMRNKKNK